jgi:hypothetical protein
VTGGGAVRSELVAAAYEFDDGVELKLIDEQSETVTIHHDGRAIWEGTWGEFEELLGKLPRLAMYELMELKLRAGFPGRTPAEYAKLILEAIEFKVANEGDTLI